MAYNPYGQICRHIKACGDNAPKLQQILDDHQAIFAKAQGSRSNHQAWEGGWLQHVADTIQIANYLYDIRHMLGENREYIWPIPFSWSSVVLVIFVHDIEKPFMQARMAEDPQMVPWNKTQRMLFRGEICGKYDINLTNEELLALTYIEGEGDHYSPYCRMMNELGALCHSADILSSRLWWNRNNPLLIK